MDNIVTRAYEFSVNAGENDKGNEIDGKPIIYESKTDIGGEFAEIIDKGALDKTDLKDVRFLVNHDMTRIPLARSRNNNANSTMQMSVDDSGMNIRVNLDTEHNKDSEALYSAVQRGDVSGMSFMFTVDGQSWDGLDTDYPTRHITSIGKVYEVSAVTFPAYEATSISARDKSSLDSARQALESARAQQKLDEEKEKVRDLLK